MMLKWVDRDSELGAQALIYHVILYHTIMYHYNMVPYYVK